MTEIREEQLHDVEAVREVNLRAFGQPQEAQLVDRLRESCDELLSLVAVVDDQVVGHVLFSPAVIESTHGVAHGMGLAPVAVLPEYQRQGIGSELIREGLVRLECRSCPYAIVLGHAEYYPRFGFEPASRYGIKSEWDVPDDAFMVLALDRSALPKDGGVAKYRPEFAEAM